MLTNGEAVAVYCQTREHNSAYPRAHFPLFSGYRRSSSKWKPDEIYLVFAMVMAVAALVGDGLEESDGDGYDGDDNYDGGDRDNVCRRWE